MSLSSSELVFSLAITKTRSLSAILTLSKSFSSIARFVSLILTEMWSKMFGAFL